MELSLQVDHRHSTAGGSGWNLGRDKAFEVDVGKMAEGFGEFGDGEEKRMVQGKGLNRGGMEVAAAAGVVGF